MQKTTPKFTATPPVDNAEFVSEKKKMDRSSADALHRTMSKSVDVAVALQLQADKCTEDQGQSLNKRTITQSTPSVTTKFAAAPPVDRVESEPVPQKQEMTMSHAEIIAGLDAQELKRFEIIQQMLNIED